MMFSRIAFKAAKPVKPVAAGVTALKPQARFISATATLATKPKGSKGRQMPSKFTPPTAQASGNEATLTIRVGSTR